MILISCCVCKVAFMGSKEWMYKLPRVGNDMSFLHYVSLLPLRKNIMWLWVGNAPFVHAIAARTNFSTKITWCNPVWSTMVLSRITPSGSFTAKQIRVSPVHLNETLRRPHQWMKEDKNPHHQQQRRATILWSTITSTLMIFSKTWEAVMVVGLVMMSRQFFGAWRCRDFWKSC